jgi:hypothetical protein
VSEYQYYEFQAVDRPLGDAEMRSLRALSTRAHITPTGFVNTYNWGDFKGDPRKLVEKYFDAFVYVANWGTHRLMLRVPREFINFKTASSYKAGGGLSVRRKGPHVIVDFESGDDADGEWDEGDSWMSALIPLREHVMNGDMRPLYLGWLACAGADELADEDLEPPVPPGLGELDPPLEALAEFLRIDPDLLTAAAEASPDAVPCGQSESDTREWVESLPDTDRADLLMRLATGNPVHAKMELLRRFRASRRRRRTPDTTQAVMTGRTVRRLLDSA